MTATADPIVSVTLDAHAWPFDGQDDNPSMVEVAETFGVMMADVTGDYTWAWVYRITGPASHVRRAIAEYWGEDDLDEYMRTAA